MERTFNKCQQYTVALEVRTNARQTVIDVNSPLNGTNIVAVRTRRTKAGAKTLQGKSLVSDTNFDAAFLIVKGGSNEVVKIPLWHIEQASLQQPVSGFPLFLAGLDVSNSYVEVVEGVTLDAGNCFELTFEFYDTKKK